MEYYKYSLVLLLVNFIYKNDFSKYDLNKYIYFIYGGREMVDNRQNDEVVPRIIMNKNDSEMNILKILKNEYHLLYNSVLKENYEFSNHEAGIFKELLFNNKVVGFVVYDVFFSIFTITDFYILPKFRDKNILLKEIHEIYESGNKINFYRPNRDVVELLIEYGFAINIVEGIVVSAMNFEFEGTTYSYEAGTHKNLNRE